MHSTASDQEMVIMAWPLYKVNPMLKELPQLVLSPSEFKILRHAYQRFVLPNSAHKKQLDSIPKDLTCSVCSDGFKFHGSFSRFLSHIVNPSHLGKLVNLGGGVTESCLQYWLDLIQEKTAPNHRWSIEGYRKMDAAVAKKLDAFMETFVAPDKFPLAQPDPRDNSEQPVRESVVFELSARLDEIVDKNRLERFMPFIKEGNCQMCSGKTLKTFHVFLSHLLTPKHLSNFRARSGIVTMKAIQFYRNMIDALIIDAEEEDDSNDNEDQKEEVIHVDDDLEECDVDEEEDEEPLPSGSGEVAGEMPWEETDEGEDEFMSDDEVAAPSVKAMPAGSNHPPPLPPYISLLQLPRGTITKASEPLTFNAVRKFVRDARMQINIERADEHYGDLKFQCTFCPDAPKVNGISSILDHAYEEEHIKHFIDAGGMLTRGTRAFFNLVARAFPGANPEPHPEVFRKDGDPPALPQPIPFLNDAPAMKMRINVTNVTRIRSFFLWVRGRTNMLASDEYYAGVKNNFRKLRCKNCAKKLRSFSAIVEHLSEEGHIQKVLKLGLRLSIANLVFFEDVTKALPLGGVLEEEPCPFAEELETFHRDQRLFAAGLKKQGNLTHGQRRTIQKKMEKALRAKANGNEFVKVISTTVIPPEEPPAKMPRIEETPPSFPDFSRPPPPFRPAYAPPAPVTAAPQRVQYVFTANPGQKITIQLVHQQYQPPPPPPQYVSAPYVAPPIPQYIVVQPPTVYPPPPQPFPPPPKHHVVQYQNVGNQPPYQ